MIVTLLTDFGTGDHYVAAMKGVILSIDASIVVIDVSHEVPPQDIRTAAYLLASCHRDFPAGTVHLAVVDPGVGSPRLAMAARQGGQFYVGPDNGIFSYAWAGSTPAEPRRIEAALPGVRTGGSTFHGRDLFAPAAAALATGFPFEKIGSPVADPVSLPLPRPDAAGDGRITAEILHVDRFGNCVTNLRPEDITHVGSRVRIHAGALTIRFVAPFYAAVAPGIPFAIIGSSGFVELSVRDDSAAERLGLNRGDSIVVESGDTAV